MSKILAIALAAGAAIVASAPADAAQGCGPGLHRGPYGHCRPNGGPGYGRGPGFRGDGYGRGPVLVIGNYYQGRGYWDGRRYYQHRERFRGGWRYR
jgi:hypothetical protein